jgi:hypothetical protein
MEEFKVKHIYEKLREDELRTHVYVPARMSSRFVGKTDRIGSTSGSGRLILLLMRNYHS